jgi:multidrug efflux pump subunit AcrB
LEKWILLAASIPIPPGYLVAQFNSFKQQFAIALSLPFGLVGAILGLWITVIHAVLLPFWAHSV